MVCLTVASPTAVCFYTNKNKDKLKAARTDELELLSEQREAG
jgi:hypothetical protein